MRNLFRRIREKYEELTAAVLLGIVYAVIEEAAVQAQREIELDRLLTTWFPEASADA